MSPLFRRRQVMTVEQFAFNMLVGATVDAAADEPYVRAIGARSVMAPDELRRELFAYRAFAIDMATFVVLKDSALFERVTHSRWVLMDMLASEGRSPFEHPMSDDELRMYAIIQMRQGRILDKCAAEAPMLRERLDTEGVARFGATILGDRDTEYREASKGGLPGIAARFAELCGAPKDKAALEAADAIGRLYHTSMRRELKLFKVVDMPGD